MNTELYHTTVACIVHVVHLEGSQSRWPVRIRRSSTVCFGYVWEEQQPTIQKRDDAAAKATIRLTVHYVW